MAHSEFRKTLERLIASMKIAFPSAPTISGFALEPLAVDGSRAFSGTMAQLVINERTLLPEFAVANGPIRYIAAVALNGSFESLGICGATDQVRLLSDVAIGSKSHREIVLDWVIKFGPIADAIRAQTSA